MMVSSRANNDSIKRKSEQVFARNQLIERSLLEGFSFRYPGLLVHACFYYKFVARGEYTVGAHGHWRWEMARPWSGEAAYSVQGNDEPVVPDSEHYLIIPPKVTHGWRMGAAPLLLNSWQLTIKPEDSDGALVLDVLKKSVKASGFLVKTSAEQILAEELLWKMAGKTYSPELFGSILCGFARIVIGDLFATINLWPEGSLELQFDHDATMRNLGRHLKTFLDENLSHPITIKEIEAHFHYSGRHLNRIFQEVYKTSIGHYLRVQRMDIAKRWLGSTDRSIKDIALSLGYSGSSHFCRYFLKQSGMTPSQFRSSTSIFQHQLGSGSLSPADPDPEKPAS